jgi:hypothetical protein
MGVGVRSSPTAPCAGSGSSPKSPLLRWSIGLLPDDSSSTSTSVADYPLSRRSWPASLWSGPLPTTAEVWS